MSNGVLCRVFQLVLIHFVYCFPQVICEKSAQYHSKDSTNSSVSPELASLNVTLTDGNGSVVFPTTTDATPEAELTDELRAQINSSNPTELYGTGTPNDTIMTDVSVALPTGATLEPKSSVDCLCDVTTDFCDIGCCCDFMDCGLLNLSSVFNNCDKKAGSGICIESWLMFRAQIDPALVTLIGDFFCVQRQEETQSTDQTSPARFQPKHLYPLLLRDLTAFSSQKNKFYKVNDIIRTYYDQASIVSTLRQPSPAPGSSACISHNPARFLRSSSTSCSRAVTVRSCVDDRNLNALTYYSGFSLLKVPMYQVEDSPELVIPISNMSDWPEPLEQNGSCLNVVSKAEYVIKYTSKGEIAEVTLNIQLQNITTDTQLLQQHGVVFQVNYSKLHHLVFVNIQLLLATPIRPAATPTAPSPPQGLKPESPLVGWFGEKSQPLTVLGLSEDGRCSAGLANRIPVLFRQNTITGCTFRSLSKDCGVLRAELLSVLVGAAVPDLISMTTGSQTDKSKVISLDCSTPASETCETSCLLPVSLSVRVLWAQMGLRVLPQNHILGVKFIFGCKTLKCPIQTSVQVTTEVTFSDATAYPEAPRGELQPEWKFPFAFFSRGVGEFDQE